MMTAYLDESGHETKNWMFVAGFLGNAEQWKQFAPKWKAALGPQRKHLHMSDLRWNRERTKRLLARLGPIPTECALTPVFGGVRYKDYEDLVTGTPEEKQLKGYIACLFPLVLQVLRTVPEDDRLELVLEQQTEYEPFANALLAELAAPNHPWKARRDGKPKLANWTFVPKCSTILTDPADYLAFALRELWTDKKSKKTQWCMPMLKLGEGIGKIQRRAEIRAIISEAFMRQIQAQLDHLLASLNSQVRKKETGP